MQNAEQGADGQLAAILNPWVKRASPPRVQANLAAFAVLPGADQHRPAGRIKIGLRESQCLTDPQPSAPQHHDDRPQPIAVDIGPAARITATISSTGGGSAG